MWDTESKYLYYVLHGLSGTAYIDQYTANVYRLQLDTLKPEFVVKVPSKELSLPVEELKYDRPRQYKALMESGELDDRLVPPPSPFLVKIAKIFGFTALFIGLSIIIMIIYSMIFLYK